jgi:hypothetical protein
MCSDAGRYQPATRDRVRDEVHRVLETLRG